jgi:hypothetical protein
MQFNFPLIFYFIPVLLVLGCKEIKVLTAKEYSPKVETAQSLEAYVKAKNIDGFPILRYDTTFPDSMPPFLFDFGFFNRQGDYISSRYNMTIDVALSVDDDMMRIYHREAADTLTYSLPDFTRNCLHNTALGKAFLSSLPEEELNGRLPQLQLTAKTEKTITDREILKKQLLLAKARRYAMTVEEFLPGLIAIAAPLLNPHTSRGIG